MKANVSILKNMQTNMTSLTNSNLEFKNMFGQFMKMNIASSSGSRTLLVVECETEATKDMVHPTNNGSTKDVQPLVFPTESPILNSETVVSPIIKPVASLIFDADPRVPLILRRSFLKTERALVDVFKGELTVHVGKEAITFNLDQTSRYPANYNDMTANRIDVIDMACEEYSQEVLGFSNVIASDNPTPYYDLIISTTSSTLTTFENNDFLLEEVDAFLALEDDLTSPEVDQSYLDSEGVEAKSGKSSIDEPPEVELKDLPPHLEYTFLEGDDKFPVIIAKDLSVEEKTALITVQMSHKQAIACKLSNIKEKMLKRCEDTSLCLNWKKSHFMVKEGIVPGHKISKEGIEVDKAKVDVISKLPHPITIKGIRSFLSHAGFYR
nr:reverse transcriptase domain-containing protein [Tanacetum cinerariifolium]